MSGQAQYGTNAAITPSDLYYRHSGQSGPGGIVLTAAAGIAVGVVLAVVYSYTVAYVPYIKLRFLATIAFGAAAGAATAAVAKATKVRSTTVLFALIAGVALVAYYASWVVWIKLTMDRAFGGHDGYDLNYADLIFKPAILWDLARAVYENGTWSMSKRDTEALSGAGLGAIWLVEAAAIIGFAIVTGLAIVGDEIFCDACNRWSGTPRVLRATAPGDPQRLRQTLESHDLSYVATLGSPTETHFWTFAVHACTSCNQLHALTVTDHRVTIAKKGERTEKKSTLVNRLLLSPDEVDDLATPTATPETLSPPPPPTSPPPIPLA